MLISYTVLDDNWKNYNFTRKQPTIMVIASKFLDIFFSPVIPPQISTVLAALPEGCQKSVSAAGGLDLLVTYLMTPAGNPASPVHEQACQRLQQKAAAGIWQLCKGTTHTYSAIREKGIH